jgi:xanthine dehydrogenase accessory factor
MDKVSIFQAIVELQRNQQAGALCTLISSKGSTPRHEGSKMLVYPDGSILGTVGGGEMETRVIKEALQAIQDGRARKLSYTMNDPARGDPGVCGGQLEVFVDPILLPPHLVVIGAGHVGKALAHVAHWMGYQVSVSDDRPEFCNPQATPDAHFYYPVSMSKLTEQLKVTPQTYIVLTTRGSSVDVEGLPTLLDSPAAYIGVIGSRKRWQETKNKMTQNGIPAEKLEKVISPIGLELNAETPEEIAISIMAEITMLRNGGSGQRMKK